MHTLDIAPLYSESPLQKCSGMNFHFHKYSVWKHGIKMLKVLLVSNQPTNLYMSFKSVEIANMTRSIFFCTVSPFANGVQPKLLPCFSEVSLHMWPCS